MKEFLFVIENTGSNSSKIVKVSANDISEAKDKFTRVCMPFTDFNYSEMCYILENNDIKITCAEFKDIIDLV